MKVGEGTKIWHPEKSVILDCEIGSNCTIHAPVWIGNGVLIGNNVKIQAFAFIPSGVIIEDDVFIGPHVCFTNDREPPQGKAFWETTLVKKGASIGANAVILPGLTIHTDALVGAGSVVTKSVPKGKTWVGNPAKPIEHRQECRKTGFKWSWF